MSFGSVLLGLWILIAVTSGNEMNQMRLEATSTVANYITHIELNHHEDLVKKPNDGILKRTKRTLVLLRNLDSEKGAVIGDACDYSAWNEHVNKIYNASNREGKKFDKEGLKLANLTRIYTENRTFSNVDPGEDSGHSGIKFKTWPKKLCIGRYPLKCDENLQKCKCLDLYPLYNFTQDLPDEKFCNVRPGDYCMESVDLYCAHSFACIDHKCQEGPKLVFNGHPGVISNKYKVMVMSILLMIENVFQ